jgi:hypothetical protein
VARTAGEKTVVSFPFPFPNVWYSAVGLVEVAAVISPVYIALGTPTGPILIDSDLICSVLFYAKGKARRLVRVLPSEYVELS